VLRAARLIDIAGWNVFLRKPLGAHGLAEVVTHLEIDHEGTFLIEHSSLVGVLGGE
jgi:hypothetical protein